MPINNLLARGFNPGAGALAGAKNAYSMKQDQQDRSRNAFVQDRSFNAQQEHRNSMLTGRQEAEEAEHQRWLIGEMQKAQTPEQARSIYEFGRQDAEKRGYDTSQAPAWEDIAGMYVAPQDPQAAKNTEYDRRQAAANTEYDRRQEADRTRPQTPTERANERKAVAQAEIAETKLADDLGKAEAGKATAGQLVSAAQALLTPEGGLAKGVGSVFGPAQGATWSIFGSTISAEAKVDQLISLLTLENVDKMTGVLSDTDIAILKSASTILNNKRIPDEVALQEIRKLAGELEFSTDSGPSALSPEKQARLEELRKKRDEGTLDAPQ